LDTGLRLLTSPPGNGQIGVRRSSATSYQSRNPDARPRGAVGDPERPDKDKDKDRKGAFADLGALDPGDQVIVDRVDRTSVRFGVQRVEQYPEDRFPTLEV
jgi:hypothetical protein